MIKRFFPNSFPNSMVWRIAAVAVVAAASMAAAAEDHAFFETRIRPVLIAHCYECHSSGSAAAEGNLLLDFRDGLRKGGDSGPAIIPGKPEQSLLIKALRHESQEMPPDGKLPDRVIADFTQWIQSGAIDPRDAPPSATEASEAAWKAKLADRRRWWSLQPPQPSEPPSVDDPAWSSESVDRFILAKLTAAGLSPAAPAEAEPLARRLSFVLTGLPPTPEQVGEFRAAYDADADSAVAGLVDRLLESPHYGERFARHWMDVVRYTDTYGYEWDNPAKGSWEYRDYLIRAFNRDIGFDQLIREQIAGDLQSEPRIDPEGGTNESLIGPMFYHLGEHRHGTSLDFNGIHQDMVDNKVDAFSKAFLAMTVACARCHDHKLDAISQADYYALAGVFMTPRWTPRDIDASDQHTAAIEQLKGLRAEIRGQLAQAWLAQTETEVFSGAGLRNWALARRTELSSLAAEDVGFPLGQLLGDIDWSIPEEITATAEAEGTMLSVDPEGTILAGGEIPATDTYTMQLNVGPGFTSQLRLEALTHESLGSGGPGRTPHGNFVLSHIRVEVTPHPDPDADPAADKPASRVVEIKAATADFSQSGYPIAAALDPAPHTGWGVGDVTPANVDREARFVFAQPVELPHGGQWRVTLVQHFGTQHVLGRFRLALASESASPESGAQRPDDEQKIVARWQQLADQWRKQRQTRQEANQQAFTSITDFAKPGFPEGWSVDGRGLEHGHVDAGAPLIALEGENLVGTLLQRGYHTHALSSKLSGAIRLPPPESFPAAMVSLRLAGGDWAGRIDIPQNAFQAEEISFFNPAAPATWRPVGRRAMNHGVTRVLTQFSTSSLNPNFPPRTGLANAGGVRLPDNDDGLNKRSWMSITGIVAHDAGGAPADTMDHLVPLYKTEAPASADDVWQELADWLRGAVHRWAADETEAEDVRVLNWMLAQGLLPNDPGSLPEVDSLVQQYRRIESQIDFARSAISMDEQGVAPIDYRLNIRGDVDQDGPAVRRNFLEVFAGRHQVADSPGSGRAELAEYLANRDNPQTARVYVNRVWQWVFGTGLVTTSSDFGKLGDRPSHPELLDWLAIRFMEEGWSTKELVRRLVLSQTFRQSGRVDEIAARHDPDNRLLHHYPTRRLEAEAIRDSMLVVSGRWNPQLYGPPINPPRVAEDASKRLFAGPWDSDGRRSIYITMSIMEPPRFLVGFNLPDLRLPTDRRDETNVPAQALILLNDPLVTRLAEHWADQLVADGPADLEQRLKRMFLTALGREPSPDELRRWVSATGTFSSGEKDPLADRKMWADIAHALFNTKEFIYYR